MAFEDVDLQRVDLRKEVKGMGFLRNWKLLIMSKACRRDSGPRVAPKFLNFGASGKDSMA